jgi:4'-phosphopantetheinyl transferase EntD
MTTVQAQHSRTVPDLARRYAAMRDFDESQLRDVEASLGVRERLELDLWRDQSRRNAWLLGRWVSRQLIAEEYGDSTASAIEILSRDAQGRVNRPRIWQGQQEQPWSLSISHTSRGAMAVLCMEAGTSVGVDLLPPEPLSDAFLRLWFTQAEQGWCRDSGGTKTASFIWAAKEAVYKAVNQGESFAPRDVEIHADGSCRYRQVPLRHCRLERQWVDEQAAAIAILRTDLQPDSIRTSKHG